MRKDPGIFQYFRAQLFCLTRSRTEICDFGDSEAERRHRNGAGGQRVRGPVFWVRFNLIEGSREARDTADSGAGKFVGRAPGLVTCDVISILGNPNAHNFRRRENRNRAFSFLLILNYRQKRKIFR